MDVWDNLLIRACKSNKFNINILRRILARRCGMSTAYVGDGFIAEKLLNLAVAFKKERNVYYYIAESAPDRAWLYGNKDADYWERVINVVASTLRLTSISELPPSYNSGRRWRNK